MGYYKEMKIRPTMLVDRVEAALRALGMANLKTFRCYRNHGLDPHPTEIYTGSSLSARAIECMEGKLGLDGCGGYRPLGLRIYRIECVINSRKFHDAFKARYECRCEPCRVEKAHERADALYSFWLGTEGLA